MRQRRWTRWDRSRARNRRRGNGRCGRGGSRAVACAEKQPGHDKCHPPAGSPELHAGIVGESPRFAVPALILVRFEGLPHEPASVVEVVAGRYDVANWRETTLLLAAASFMKLESDSTLKVRSPTVWTQSSFGPQEAEPRPLTTRDVDTLRRSDRVPPGRAGSPPRSRKALVQAWAEASHGSSRIVPVDAEAAR